MWKQDLKKIGMLTVGLGAAYALYNSRQPTPQPILFQIPNNALQDFFRDEVKKLPDAAKEKVDELKVEDEVEKSKILEEAKSKLEAAKEMTVDKTKEIAETAQEKVDDLKETGRKFKTMAVEEAKTKLEVAREALEGMKEKVVSKKEDGGDAKKDHSD